MRGLEAREEGAVATLVLVSLVVLLGMAALVVDIGDGYWERRMLQNSADAAALAVASDCVGGVDCGPVMSTANTYATDNNRRGAHVVSVTGPDGVNPPQPSDGRLTVVTSTGDEASAGRLLQYFSGALGQEEGLQGRARATVAWGATTGGVTIPLTLSECEWVGFGGPTLDPSGSPIGPEFVYFADPGKVNLCDGPAGLDYPGGFGWLDVVTDPGGEFGEFAGQCQSVVTLGEADGQTGNTAPKPAGTTGCTAQFFQNLVTTGTTVLMPIHDDEIVGQGAGTKYEVIGFAGLRILGFKLGGPPEWRFPAGFSCPEGPPATNCIEAEFLFFRDVDSVPTPGGDLFGSVTFGLIE